MKIPIGKQRQIGINRGALCVCGNKISGHEGWCYSSEKLIKQWYEGYKKGGNKMKSAEEINTIAMSGRASYTLEKEDADRVWAVIEEAQAAAPEGDIRFWPIIHVKGEKEAIAIKPNRDALLEEAVYVAESIADLVDDMLGGDGADDDKASITITGRILGRLEEKIERYRWADMKYNQAVCNDSEAKALIIHVKGEKEAIAIKPNRDALQNVVGADQE